MKRPAARLEGPAEGLVRGQLPLRNGVAPPFRLADRLHRLLTLLGVHPVDEQDPVQVVGLVLDAAREQFRALDGDRLAVHIEALGHDPPRPLDRVHQAGERQAALVVLVGLLGQVEDRVDQVPGLVVIHVVRENPQTDADLGRGQADAGRFQHSVGQVLHQPSQLGVEVTDRLRRGPQDRVAEQTDGLHAHDDKSIRQTTSAGSSSTRMPPPSLRALRPAWAACRARARSSPCARAIRIRARSPPSGVEGPAPAGTGPSTSAPAGSLAVSRKSARTAGSPLISAIRTAGGKPSSVRSASSRSEKMTGFQPISACTAGSAASARTTTGAAARMSAAALSQRRRVSSAARRLGRPSSAQPSSSNPAAYPLSASGSAPGVAITRAGSPGTVASTWAPPEVRTGMPGNARPSSSAVLAAPVTRARTVVP